MKTIEIKRANWKSNEFFLGQPANITTLVIQQGKTIIDPSDKDFLSALIKEYVRNHGKSKSTTLKLSPVETFYFGENANAYMLNHIYKTFFGSKIKKPFNAILHDKEEKEYINIGLFNVSSKQVSYLVDILIEMKIDLKKLSKKYTVLAFPHSLDDYDTSKLYDFEYSEAKA